MRTLTLTVLAAALWASPAFSQGASAEGVWILPEDSARIRISPCANQAGRLCGTIVSIKPRPPAAGKAAPKTKDGKAPPSAQSMIGRTIMVGFKPNGAGKWNGGKFQFPGSDRTINATMAMNKDGTLRVNGCVLVMCGGQNWKRAA